jgi:hypothetical protein
MIDRPWPGERYVLLHSRAKARGVKVNRIFESSDHFADGR